MSTQASPCRNIRGARATASLLCAHALLLLTGTARAEVASGVTANLSLPMHTDARESPFSIRVAAGAGVAGRELEFPTERGDRLLSTDPFTVLTAAVVVDAPVAYRWRLGAELSYVTSVGLKASQLPTTEDREARGSLRSQDATLGVSAAYRFAGLGERLALRATLGWAIQDLQTASEVGIPSYALHGPFLRPNLSVRLVGDMLEVDVAPEFRAVVGMGTVLQRIAVADLPGFAVGGSARLRVRLHELFHAQLVLSQLHVFVGNAFDDSLVDVQRQAALLLSLVY